MIQFTLLVQVTLEMISHKIIKLFDHVLNVSQHLLRVIKFQHGKLSGCQKKALNQSLTSDNGQAPKLSFVHIARRGVKFGASCLT